MKSSTLNAVLQGALAFSVILSGIFCLQYIFLNRETRSIGVQLNMANAYRSTVQALAADCLRYSETNAAIDPLLKSFGVTKQPK